MPRKNSEQGVKPYACPACREKGTISCGEDYLANNFRSSLSKVRDLKFGALSRCLECGADWFHDTSSQSLILIQTGKLDCVLEWDKRDLSVPPGFQPVLERIGATPPDLYGNGRESIAIPCRCILKNGTTLDFALISIQKTPPIGNDYGGGQTYFFIDDIDAVEESEYTLPPAARVLTTEAEEISMSYAPSYLEAPDKNIYQLNWTNNFFRTDTLKGKDMIPPKSAGFNKRNCLTAEYSYTETRVIADWKDQYLSLRLKPGIKS